MDDVQNILYNNIDSDIDDEDMPSLISDSDNSDNYDIDNTYASNISDNTDTSNTHTINTNDTHINTSTIYNNTSQQYNYNFQYINHLHNMNDMIINNILNVENLNIQNIDNLNNTLQTFIHNYPSENADNTIHTNNAHYERIRNEINNLLTINRNRSTLTTPLISRNVLRNENYNGIRSEIELLYNSDDYYMFYDDNSEHSYEYLSDLIESMGKVEIGVKDINIAAPEYKDHLLLPHTTCVICQEDNFTLPIRKTLCNHLFCSDCISQWLKKHHTCPLCLCDLNDILIDIKNDVSIVNDCS